MKKSIRLLLFTLGLFLFAQSLPARAESAESTERAENTEKPESTEGAGDLFRNNGIPVLTLTVDPKEFQKVLESPRHEYQAENCTLRIDIPEGYVCEYGEPDGSLLGRELPLEYFRGRGNSTWFEDKKPFKFRLEESADLLSMGANEHWVLLANAKDPSLLRNRIISYIGDAFGLAYTSKYVPVDLFVNGEYQGSYMLAEQVRIGENRVDIDKIRKSDTEEPEISGGYLLAMAPSLKDPEIGQFSLESGLSFLVDTPDLSEYDESKQEGLAAQKAYIADYLQRVEDAVYGSGFRNGQGEALSDLMDLESAAKYWWVQTFAMNDDGFASTSSYLYKVRDGKLFWGPLWDFDRSLWLNGNAGTLSCEKMPWLDHLRAENPEYQQLLRDSWEELDGILEELCRDGGVLDAWKEEMRLSWAQNYVLWYGEEPEDGAFDGTVDDLKLAITIRREEIRAVIDEALTKVYSTVTFTDGDRILAEETIYTRETLPKTAFPEVPEREGFEFLFWADEDGMIFGPDTEVIRDLRVHAEYQAKETVPEPSETAPAEAAKEGKISVWLFAGAGAAVLLIGAGAVILRLRRRTARQ